MAEFKDTEGRLWHPHVTFGTLKEVYRRTGVKLWTLAPIDDMEDPYAIMDMVFASVHEEARERNVSIEDWHKLFDAGPLMPMLSAFQDALVTFAHGESPPEIDSEPRPT